jgi:Flp pilus assembly protein TadD
MGLAHLAQEHALIASGENGEDPRPFRILAERLVRAGDPAAALRLVDGALLGNRASEWGRSELFTTRGQVLEVLGEPADARRAYEQALRELPHNEEARGRLAGLPRR